MEQAILSELTKHGLLGIVALALGLVVIAIARAYVKGHEARITDTKEFQSKYVGLVEKGIETSADVNVTLTVIKEKLPK